MENNSLTHWGIKGMRWGIRRYQNKDGSLTPAGKKRLKAESEALKKEEQVLKNRKATKAKIDRLEAKRKALADQKKELNGDDDKTKKSNTDESKPAKKSVKDMSNEELMDAITRARLEDTYTQLRPEPVVEKNPVMKKFIKEVVEPAAISSGKKLLENTMSNLVEKATGGKSDPNSIEALTKVRDKLKLQSEIKKYQRGETDDDLSWDERIKKQTWERNKKKYDAEDAAARKAAEDAAREKRNRGVDDFVSKAAGDADTHRSSGWERTAKSVRDNIDFDDNSSRSSSKVYEGTVEGFGTSAKTTNRARKWTSESKIFDADYYEVVNDNNASAGRSYTSSFLALPAPGLPEPRDDD